MTEERFWAIIAMLDWAATGDDEAVIAPAVAELAKHAIEEIYEFENILAQKLYALDTIAHARQIGGEDAYREGEYFSPDLFLYARCVVVANGEDLYKRVLQDPREFPEFLEFESLLYIGRKAFLLKTDRKFDHVTTPSYETYSNAEGWR